MKNEYLLNKYTHTHTHNAIHLRLFIEHAQTHTHTHAPREAAQKRSAGLGRRPPSVCVHGCFPFDSRPPHLYLHAQSVCRNALFLVEISERTFTIQSMQMRTINIASDPSKASF